MACKNLTNISTSISKFKNITDLLAELFKRLPPNQIEQFIEFRVMCHDYKARVDKFPAKLPKIDWEYYRTNVRTDYIKMVDDFEKKYEELNKIFDNRGQLDTTKYFKEVDKVKDEVKVDIEKYIKESNERIKQYEKEIERLRTMIPYEEMTCEDYCILVPENAHTFGVGESFWPHTPEEQPGYVEPELKINKEEMTEGATAAGEPKTAEVPQTSPKKETPSTASTTPTPKTAEEPQPSPAKEKPDPEKVTPLKQKTDEVPQPAPTKQKVETTSKEAEVKPSTKKKESDKDDDPKKDGEKK